MGSVALFSYRRRRSVLMGWIVLLVAVFALSQTAGGVFRNELALSGSEPTGGPMTGKQVVPSSWQELPGSGPMLVASDRLLVAFGR